MDLLHIIPYGKNLFFKEHTLPVYLTFFVTSRCNLTCKHCFYWKELNRPEQELSLEEIENISSHLGHLLVLALTGGEPFLRKDLVEIMQIFDRNTQAKVIYVITNGFNPGLIEGSVRRACLSLSNRLIVQVSIDGFEAEHDKIRGFSGSFRRAVETFRRLKALKAEFSNLGVGIVSTYNALNQDTFEDFLRFAALELRPDMIGTPLIRGTPQEQGLKNIGVNGYERIIHIKRELMGKSGYVSGFLGNFVRKNNDLVEDIMIRTVRTGRYQLPCYASRLSCVLGSDGTVHSCETLSNRLGNLRECEYNLGRIWFSEKNKSIRDGIIKNRCFCTHSCNISVNTSFNPLVFSQVALSSLSSSE